MEPRSPERHSVNSGRLRKDQIFISLRFAEAADEARALKAALTEHGVSVFISDAEVPAGADLADQISRALDTCALTVVLATRTYGRKTGPFSTFNEFQFVVGYNRPFFLVKMAPEWEEAHVRLALGAQTMYHWWTPGESLPPDLVPAILARLAQLDPDGFRPEPDAAIPEASHESEDESEEGADKESERQVDSTAQV